MMRNAVSRASLGHVESVLVPSSLPKNTICFGFLPSSNRSIFYRKMLLCVCVCVCVVLGSFQMGCLWLLEGFQRGQAGRISCLVGNFGHRYPGVIRDCTRVRRPDFPFRNHEASAGLSATGFPSPQDASSEVCSRVRGLSFFTVSGILSIPLFLLMVIFHPLVLVFDRNRRRTQHLVAKVWASASVYPFFRIEFEGLENLPPPDLPAVYVSNHQSFLDIYTLLTLGRSFKFISKTAIFLIPVIGWAMFIMGLIPLRRMDNKSQLKGAFTVAAKTGVPIVPITLIGTGKMMPSGMEGTLNPGAIKVVIHKNLEGKNADELCGRARDVIAEGLHQGYRI